MANIEMLRPYIEKQIQEILGIEKLFVSPNGDIPVTAGSSVVYARLMEGPSGPLLRITAPVLRKVEKKPELLERLNDLNANIFYVKVFFADDNIYMEMDLFADDIQRNEIHNALDAISLMADKYDDLLKQEFGGERMREEDQQQPAGDGAPSPDGAPAGEKTGYL